MVGLAIQAFLKRLSIDTAKEKNNLNPLILKNTLSQLSFDLKN